MGPRAGPWPGGAVTGAGPGPGCGDVPDPQSVHTARGIDHIPAEERYGTPRHLGAMWTGALFNISNVVYGALLVSIGLDFTQAVVGP